MWSRMPAHLFNQPFYTILFIRDITVSSTVAYGLPDEIKDLSLKDIKNMTLETVSISETI